MTGRFSDHHAFLARLHLDLIDNYTIRIEQLTERINTLFTPALEGSLGEPGLAQARDLLVTIPGLSTTAAERIIAEIGINMTVFPSSGRLAS